jgi:hypothetical protein
MQRRYQRILAGCGAAFRWRVKKRESSQLVGSDAVIGISENAVKDEERTEVLRM